MNFNTKIPRFLLLSCASAIVFVLITQQREAMGLYLANCLFAALVLWQGTAALWLMWHLELFRGRRAVPFAWTYFAVQHIAFGFGGALSAFFDNNYVYGNAMGSFNYGDGIIPLLSVHIVSLNAGLFGVWITGLRRKPQNPRLLPPEPQWEWSEMAPLCYSSLALHALIWVWLVHLGLPGIIGWAISAASGDVTAAFIFWGMAWGKCRTKGKLVFIAYNSVFVTLQMIIGGRGNYMYSLLLFGLGYALSPAGRQFKVKMLWRYAPVAGLIVWSFLITEDLRSRFVRGTPDDFADAIARLSFLSDSIESGTSDSKGYNDYALQPINGAFRIGSRLFELSAMNVVTETPEHIGYWGWDDEDWSILLTGITPNKLTPDAAYLTSDTAGVGFLRQYGFSQVDPEAGNSMPATIAADSWRRFGWLGVVPIFVCVGWSFASLTSWISIEDKRKPWLLMIAGGIAANYAFVYTLDITSLVSTAPRRAVAILAYAGLLFGVQRFFRSVSNNQPRVLTRYAQVREVSVTPQGNPEA